MGKLFGTDGIRGIANTEITPKLVFDVGRAVSYVISNELGYMPKVIVGKDTRISGSMLESALACGMCSLGAEVVLAGVVPTPAVAYITKKQKFDIGVVISASHNHFRDNGIKFFDSEGYKLRDELENKIENIIYDGLDKLKNPADDKIGKISNNCDISETYFEFLKTTISVKSFGNLKIVADFAHGATFAIGQKILKHFAQNLIVLNDNPNGININNNCGSTHLDNVREGVLRNNADIGIAYDGDGDRCLLIDETGKIIDGDQIMTMCALELKQKNKLNHNGFVATVMSNLGLFEFCNKNDINAVCSKVGDRYVLEKMLLEGYNFGGEQSGHIIFLDYNTTGDGILTSLKILEQIVLKNKKLSEFANIMNRYPQVIINAKVSNTKKHMYLENEIVKNAIDEANKKFSHNGRVLVRPSGTEALIRIMIEGKDVEIINKEAKKIASIVELQLS